MLVISGIGVPQTFAQIHETQQLEEVKIVDVADSSMLNTSKSSVQQLTDQLLAATPGITLIKRGNFAQEPTIRGFNQGQITLSIDGMRLFGACTDRMDPISSYIEPNNLGSISTQFSPNGNSVASTLGGGIDFQLKKPIVNDSKKISGLLGGGYEWNAHAYQTLGALQFSGKKWGFRINGIYRSAQNYWAANRKEILYSQYQKWNAGASFVVQLKKNHLLYIDYLQDEGYHIGYPALTMDVAFAKTKIAAVTHVYENQDKKMYHAQTKLYFNYIDHAMDDSRRPDSLVPIRMDMPGFSYTAGFFTELKWRLNQHHLMKAKWSSFYNQIHAEMTMYPTTGSEMFMLTIPDAGRFSSQLSVHHTWFLSNKISMESGITAEISYAQITSQLGRQTVDILAAKSYSQSRFLWNAFVQWDFFLHKNVKWNVNISKGMRQATSQELFGFYLFNRVDNFDYWGNPNLKTEQSLNLNTSVGYKKGIFSLESRFFGYWIQNYIAGEIIASASAMTVGASGVKQYVNLKNAYIFGGEIALALQIYKGLKITSVNTYTHAFDFRREALPYIAPFKSVNSLSYHIKGYHFTLESVTAAAQRHISSFYGENASKPFSILHFYAHKTFVLPRKLQLDVQLFVTNITDANYYEHLDVIAIARQGRSFGTKVTLLF